MNSDIGHKNIQKLNEHSVLIKYLNIRTAENSIKIDKNIQKLGFINRKYKRELKKIIQENKKDNDQSRNNIAVLMEHMVDQNRLVVECYKTETDRIEREFNKKHDNHETRITTLEKFS